MNGTKNFIGFLCWPFVLGGIILSFLTPFKLWGTWLQGIGAGLALSLIIIFIRSVTSNEF
jgi:hypothetical protein